MSPKMVFSSLVNIVWDFTKSFNAFNVQSIPRKENRHTNRLVLVGASYDVPRSLEDEKK